MKRTSWSLPPSSAKGMSNRRSQVATSGATVRLGDVAMLIVHPDPESEAVPEQEQMPSGAAANIDHPHPFRDDVEKEVELDAQEGLDLGRLRGRIQSPIQ